MKLFKVSYESVKASVSREYATSKCATPRWCKFHAPHVHLSDDLWDAKEEMNNNWEYISDVDLLSSDASAITEYEKAVTTAICAKGSSFESIAWRNADKAHNTAWLATGGFGYWWTINRDAVFSTREEAERFIESNCDDSDCMTRNSVFNARIYPMNLDDSWIEEVRSFVAPYKEEWKRMDKSGMYCFSFGWRGKAARELREKLKKNFLPVKTDKNKREFFDKLTYIKCMSL